MIVTDKYFKEHETESGSAYIYACEIKVNDDSKVFGQVKIHKRVSISDRYVVQAGVVQCHWFTNNTNLKTFLCHQQRKQVTQFMLEQVIELAEHKRRFSDRLLNVEDRISIKYQ